MSSYYQSFEYVNEASTSSEPGSLKLIFTTRLYSPVFTGKKIRGEGGNESIGVVLVNSLTNQQVNSGPAASAKVKIVLLPEDFGETGVVWTPPEFKNNIINNWKKKKNILLGNLILVLKNGSGTVGEIHIKHDRNYQSKGKFRLGAMAVDFSHEVKEAVSDPFEIKDSRNELISKNRPLSPTDKVWKLKNIGKKGRKLLEGENVVTVKDFLDKFSSDPKALKNIFGGSGRKWEVTVRHAKTCIDNVGYNVEPYEPGPYEHGPFDNTMVDEFPSTSDIEACLELWSQFQNNGFEPCQPYLEDGTCGASTKVGGGQGTDGVTAKKRWIKLCRVWLSMVYFMKKIGGVVRH